MQRNQWLAAIACALLPACGVGSSPKSERVQQQRTLLALPPQISPDFAIGDAVADFDRSATLLNVSGSAAGGYLLSYSRVQSNRFTPRVARSALLETDPDLTELVLMHWNALSGTPTTLARFSSNNLTAVRSVDVG